MAKFGGNNTHMPWEQSQLPSNDYEMKLENHHDNKSAQSLS